MIIEGKFTIKAGLQQTWDSLLKADTLAGCIPGCEKMVAVDDRNFDTVVVQKVGPISVKFELKTTLTEVVPPTHLKAVGKGQDMRKQGNISQETVVELKEVPPGEVEVSYTSNITIAGRLATFGDRIMRLKAKELEKQFTKSLQEKLSGKPAK